jgi:hypothetical protein
MSELSYIGYLWRYRYIDYPASNGRIMVNKELGRFWREVMASYPDYYPVLCLKRLKKASVKMAGVPAEIRTAHLFVPIQNWLERGFGEIFPMSWGHATHYSNLISIYFLENSYLLTCDALISEETVVPVLRTESYPDTWGSRFSRNVGKYLPDYMASLARIPLPIILYWSILLH